MSNKLDIYSNYALQIIHVPLNFLICPVNRGRFKNVTLSIVNALTISVCNSKILLIYIIIVFVFFSHIS